MHSITLTPKQKAVLLGVLAISTLLIAGPAAATGSISFNGNGKSLGTLFSNLTQSIKGAGPLVTALCYVGALCFGFIGALKWKAHGEQPERTTLKIPLIYWGVAVILAGFPEYMGTGITSLWGSGASVVSEPY